MSASEKLKALEALLYPNENWLNYGRVAALNKLEAVLPQIRALVEAAEATTKEIQQYGRVTDHAAAYQLRVALVALDEALS